MTMTISQAADYVQAVVEGKELDLSQQGEIDWNRTVVAYVSSNPRAVCMTKQQLAHYRMHVVDDPRAKHFLGAPIRISDG